MTLSDQSTTMEPKDFPTPVRTFPLSVGIDEPWTDETRNLGPTRQESREGARKRDMS